MGEKSHDKNQGGEGDGSEGLRGVMVVIIARTTWLTQGIARGREQFDTDMTYRQKEETPTVWPASLSLFASEVSS